MKVYADDVKFYCVVNNVEDKEKLQGALDRFYEWTKQLDLKLSIEKCMVMHFGARNHNYVYTLCDQEIIKTTIVKDLGVLTTPDLKYSEHVKEIVTKASRRANWILRSFIVSEPELYIKLFNCYVLPILTHYFRASACRWDR